MARAHVIEGGYRSGEVHPTRPRPCCLWVDVEVVGQEYDSAYVPCDLRSGEGNLRPLAGFGMVLWLARFNRSEVHGPTGREKVQQLA